MFRFLIGTILGVFLLVIVGSVILEVFPQLLVATSSSGRGKF